MRFSAIYSFANLRVCTSRPVSYMFCVPIAPDLRTSLFFPCLLTTTSDSSFVRMVGVEPTILTTIGIRLLSTQSFIYRFSVSRFPDWRFRKTSIPNLIVTVVDFSPARTYCRFPDKYGSTSFPIGPTSIFVLPYLAVRSHITISLLFTCTPACI